MLDYNRVFGGVRVLSWEQRISVDKRTEREESGKLFRRVLA